MVISSSQIHVNIYKRHPRPNSSIVLLTVPSLLLDREVPMVGTLQHPLAVAFLAKMLGMPL
jgi:hypothetical protein